MQSRVILLNADQKIYLTKTYSLIFNFLRGIAQIASLMLFSSFLIFLIIQVIATLANNLVVYFRAGKLYPYVRAPSTSLSPTERRSIWSSTKAMLLYRISILTLNQSTAVFISVIVGTLALGYYSNYLLVVGAAVMVTESAFGALTPSIGNLAEDGDKGRQSRVFDSVILISLMVHGMSAVTILTLIDDFITLWLGSDFTLPFTVVIAISFNFYVAGIIRTLWSFLSGTGLFRQTRTMVVLTAILGIAFALIFGHLFGLVGIIAAPTLAQLLTQAWYEPWILARKQFSRKVLPYFWLQLKALTLWVCVAGITFGLGTMATNEPLVALLVKSGALAVLLPLGSWLMFGRTATFQAVIHRMRTVINIKQRM